MQIQALVFMSVVNCTKLFLCFGALAGAAGVIAGAIGAHLLLPHLSESMAAAYDTATYYLLLHALALMITGALLQSNPAKRWLQAAGFAFALGIVLFSGALLVRAGADIAWISVVAPYGGMLLIGAWLALAIGALTL